MSLTEAPDTQKGSLIEGVQRSVRGFKDVLLSPVSYAWELKKLYGGRQAIKGSSWAFAVPLVTAVGVGAVYQNIQYGLIAGAGVYLLECTAVMPFIRSEIDQRRNVLLS